MKKQLTKQQMDKIQTFVLYPIIGLIAILILYLMFRPADTAVEGQKHGFNTEITDGQVIGIEEDKTKVYEKDMLSKKEQERNYIKDLGSMLAKQDKMSGEDSPSDELYLDSKRTEVKASDKISQVEKTIKASNNAYRDINRNLSSFYDVPKADSEKEQLQKRIEELEAQQEEQALQNQQVPQVPTMEEQIALLERSYELAAKYNNQGSSGGSSTVTVEPPTTSDENSGYKNGKAQIADIKQVQEQTVSSLAQPMTNEEFVLRYINSQRSFNTAVGRKVLDTKNTIAICVHSDQTITDGQAVRMRLLEPMMAGNDVIPRGAIITGVGKVQGERLFINVGLLEYRGTIIPVELLVADSDGQEGIFIPNSMELNAVKEVAANLGTNLGTTINLNQQSAGEQILTDLGKGAIQGLSQYIGKKMREVKVHLKAGHRLMLFQEENQ